MSGSADAPARSLFDGVTTQGWTAVPRLPVAIGPGWPQPDWPEDQAHRQAAVEHAAVWQVEDGALVGRQASDGLGYGGYLVSDDVFEDFELSLSVRVDWPVDTGILLRTTTIGAQGYQVLLDHRRSGGLAGFYGNGIGGFHALAWTVDVSRDEYGRPTGLVQEDLIHSLEPPTPAKARLLTRSATADAVLKAWRWDGWNDLVISCAGRHPTITTWINGVLAAEVVTGALPSSVYDRDGVERILEGSGHIALEVHDHDLYLPPGVEPATACRLGTERWGPGAACRWREIRVRSL